LSGITSSGLISGIDTASLIDSLLQVAARPRLLAQQRLVQLQTQQAALLDINTRISGIRTAAQNFRTNDVFRAKAASVSAESVLSARASNTAQPGTYHFMAHRLVSTQHLMTRGFADRDTTAVGATAFTFESTLARLDRDTRLGDLNGGEGIERGYISITDANGATREVDLTRVATLNEIVEAINTTEGLDVEARVSEGRLVIDRAVSLSQRTGSRTLETLGLAGKTAADGRITGDRLLQMSGTTPLSALNDGTGVDVNDDFGVARYDFTITINGQKREIVIGNVYKEVDDDNGEKKVVLDKGPASTIGEVLERINEKIADLGGEARLNAETGAIDIVGPAGATIVVEERATTGRQRTTAEDLGLLGASNSGTLSGRRVLADANTTLVSALNGGQGLKGGRWVEVSTGEGDFEVDLAGVTTIEEVLDRLNSHPGNGGTVVFSLDERGTGIVATAKDASGNPTDLSILGDAAEALGLRGSSSEGRLGGTNLQRQWVAEGMALSSLLNGASLGSGTLRIRDAEGQEEKITISSDVRTVGDLLKAIKSGAGSLKIDARINANGDGIEIVDLTEGVGGVKMKVEDVSGTIAARLNLAGEASGTGAENRIDGTFERRVEFAPDDTLDKIVEKINRAGAGVSASVVRDGSGSRPFRLNLVSTASGEAGRFVLDSGGLDLGLRTIDEGHNARAFFGSTDPATAILLESDTNTIDGAVPGLAIDLKSVGSASVTVTRDTSAIESQVDAFVKAFNDAISRIDHQTRYDQASEQRGPLLGDGTMHQLRRSLFNAINAPVQGFTGTYTSLLQVGIKVGGGGKTIEFDKEAFRKAYQEDPAAVEALFTRRDIDPNSGTIELEDGVTVKNPDAQTTFTALGVIGQIEQLAERYVNSVTGTLTARRKGLDEQMAAQQSRIDSMTAALERKRTIMERQFAAMESTIAQLQSQQGALNQLGRIGQMTG